MKYPNWQGAHAHFPLSQMWQATQQSAASLTASVVETPPAPPLVVDLDGTLLRTDLLHESALRLLKQRPWTALLIPLWLIRGRAYLKHRIFELARPDCDLLPIHQELLAWLRDEKKSGRLLVLATASDERLAEQAVDRLELFNIVLGSDLDRNLKGRKKLEVVAKICGPEFDYAGNSRADQPLWQASREAIVVNAGKSVESAARQGARVTRVFDPLPNPLQAAFRSLLLYQWLINLLIFLPAFTAHADIARSAAAFFAFSLCASGVAVLSQLLHLDEDRRHGTKRNRPFASGQCPIATGVMLSGVCLLASVGLAGAVGFVWLPLLLLYGCVSWYSLKAKKLSMVSALMYAAPLLAGFAIAL